MTIGWNPSPSLETWLTLGGDARIVRNELGRNAYGYPPHPLSKLSAFGSSTASAISPQAYEAARLLHERLPDPLPPEVYASEWERIRQELRELWRLGERSATDFIFGASGSHIHLLAAQLLGRVGEELPVAVLADAGETGRFVPAALRGCHFGGENEASVADDSITGRIGQIVTVPVWASGGTLRDPSAIDADFVRLVCGLMAKQQKVLLVLLDVSKSGLILPSVACALELKARYSERLTLLVDACQFRLARATLRAYLNAGCMVALTGSKFLTGPAFSGLLLVPEPLAGQYRETFLAPALSPYSSQADWPSRWPGAASLALHSNRGLLLRWEAALTEYRVFCQIQESEISDFLGRFVGAIQGFMTGEPLLKCLILPGLNRTDLLRETNWDSLPTILPFLIEDSQRGRFMSHDETMAVFHRLQADRSSEQAFALGQPVACGMEGGRQLSALRLALSVSQLVRGIQQPQVLIEEALSILERLAWTFRHR